MNTLIVIGWLGIRRAYLNLPREEAIRRYVASEEFEDDTSTLQIDEFTFADEFGCYDAWRTDP